MTEKKKPDENLTWTMVMTVLPVVILMNAGNELTDDSRMRILYAGIFGGRGGLIGFTADFLTKDKKRGVKIFSTVIIVAISVFTTYILSSKPTDSEIINQRWVTQKIGKIEFDTPAKLELMTNEVPDSAKWFYSEMNFYSDGGKERVTSFLKAKVLIDTISIEDVYSAALGGMLQKLDIEKVALEVFYADEEEISSLFSFKLNGERVNGFGFMYLKENTMESIWLMPLKRGFSREYIEEYEAGILPDYE